MAQKHDSVSMPKEWFDQLEELAASYSPKNDRPQSLLGLIRATVVDKYLQLVK